MLTDDAIEYINRSVLCWLATVDANGFPNVSPKEVFAAFGRDYLVIANIASPTSVRNISVNANVCVSYIDVFVQKGFKVCGTAEIIHPSDEQYHKYEEPLFAITRGIFPIQSIIAARIETIEPIIAPSYCLVPGTSEVSQTASAMATYGVVAKQPPV